MATNPMQRKSRNSFLLGMLMMLVICGCIIGLLFVQLKNYRDKEETEKKESLSIYVLGQDVKSGEIITSDMLISKVINKSVIPQDAIGTTEMLDNLNLQDKEGNLVTRKYENNNSKLYITKNNKEYEIGQEDTGNYYITVNNEKQYIELNSAPVIAKVSMGSNTILTRGAVDVGESTTADDVRKQEYNVIVLPTQIQTGDYVDIRLAMPTGEDYIVVSKKEVTIPVDGSGTEFSDIIWMNLSEDEIVTMNSAIVDAFRITGSKLYATTYTEAGIQAAATTTYPVSREALTLIDADPNIIERAKQGLIERYNTTQRNAINNNIGDGEEAKTNVETKNQQSITSTQETRQKYLDSLSSSSGT